MNSSRARGSREPSTEVSSLADALARAFFDHLEPDRGTSHRVDRALAAALDGVEWLVDRCDDSDPDSDSDSETAGADLRLARASFDLLAEVRQGRCDRVTTRSVSGVLLHRLVAHVGLDGPTRPLAVALAALAVLPGDVDDRSFDPTPDPAWPLEAEIVQTLADPAARLGFLAAAADAELHLPIVTIEPGAGTAAVQFIPLMRHGRPAIAAYTSPERMNRHARTAGVDVPGLVFRGRELAEVLPSGHGVILNPGSVLGLAISEAEVGGLVSGGHQDPR